MNTNTKHAPDDDLSEGALQAATGSGSSSLLLQGIALCERDSSGRREGASSRRPTSCTPDRGSEELELALIRAVFGGGA